MTDETPREPRTPEEIARDEHPAHSANVDPVESDSPESDSAGPQVDETADFAEPVSATDHVNSAEHDGTVDHVVPTTEEETATEQGRATEEGTAAEGMTAKEHRAGEARADERTTPPELVNPPEPAPPARLEMPPEVVGVPAAASVSEVDNTAVLPSAAEASTSAPIVAPTQTPAQTQTHYVEAPVPPRKKSNRGVGTLIALLSAVIFAALFAVAVAVIRSARGGIFAFDFFAESPYYVPVIFFAVGFIILVLLVNRAGWWVHVFGSIFVGLFVYFGTIATLLVIAGVISETPSQAGILFAAALSNPFEIAAALIAREVALWMGFAISARGRRVKARNVEARSAYDAEVAEKRAEYDRANTVTA